MWLDELNDLVEQLHERINKHGEVLRKSESTTRYALIDPLLTKIGWDLPDPDKVRTEHVIEAEQAKPRLDYAMLQDHLVCLVVEAKALGKPLEFAERGQAIGYCHEIGCRYYVVTDGDRWEGYDIKADGSLPQQRRLNFRVTDKPPKIMDLFWLWPGNFRGKAEPPHLHEPPVDQRASVGGPRRSPARQRPPTAATPLPQVRYTSGMNPPQRLWFPDGKARDVSRWLDIQVAVVAWLVDSNQMKNLPVLYKGKTVLVNREPKRANGSNFQVPRLVKKNHWIDTNQSGKNHLKKAEQILKECGISPETVGVEFG